MNWIGFKWGLYIKWKGNCVNVNSLLFNCKVVEELVYEYYEGIVIVGGGGGCWD